MATINLGRIKPVNKGTWSNSTTYAVDDFVQYTDNGVLSTYIAVATSTNQTPFILPHSLGTLSHHDISH